MMSVSDLLKILSVRVKKILWLLGLHAFLLILFLILVDLIWGGFVYYQYVYMAESQAPQANGSVIKFDAKTYQVVLDELQVRGQISAPAPIPK